MNYIEKDELLHEIGKLPLVWEYGEGVSDCYDIVKSAPTISAVPIDFVKEEIEKNHNSVYAESLHLLLREWAEREKE